jgi:hypothetical protein
MTAKYPFGETQAFCSQFLGWLRKRGYDGWWNGSYVEVDPLPPPEMVAEYNRQARPEVLQGIEMMPVDKSLELRRSENRTTIGLRTAARSGAGPRDSGDHPRARRHPWLAIVIGEERVFPRPALNALRLAVLGPASGARVPGPRGAHQRTIVRLGILVV